MQQSYNLDPEDYLTLCNWAMLLCLRARAARDTHGALSDQILRIQQLLDSG